MNATTLKRLSMLEQLISPAGDRESTDEEQMACALETLTDAERAAFDAATGSGSRAKPSPEQQAVIETVEKRFQELKTRGLFLYKRPESDPRILTVCYL